MLLACTIHWSTPHSKVFDASVCSYLHIIWELHCHVLAILSVTNAFSLESFIHPNILAFCWPRERVAGENKEGEKSNRQASLYISTRPLKKANGFSTIDYIWFRFPGVGPLRISTGRKGLFHRSLSLCVWSTRWVYREPFEILAPKFGSALLEPRLLGFKSLLNATF